MLSDFGLLMGAMDEPAKPKPRKPIGYLIKQKANGSARYWNGIYLTEDRAGAHVYSPEDIATYHSYTLTKYKAGVRTQLVLVPVFKKGA